MALMMRPQVIGGALVLLALTLWLLRRPAPLLSSGGGGGGGEKVPFSFSSSVTLPPADPAGARPRVLVTGGAGYIASHTIVELIGAGYAVTILDNLVNSSPESVARVRKLVDAPEAIAFVKGDVRDEAVLSGILSASPHVAVIHFAALKAVGESISRPLDYYENNLAGLVTVLAAVRAYGIKQVVFSSSATVYGNAAPPFTEATAVGVGITNPYGQTKYVAEIILRDFTAANPDVAVACLRYFNPVGAHASGTIGEDPKGVPNNLMPFIQRVAVGKYPQLAVHGSDYATPDGTAQRDYIHVVDLAKGHVKAVAWLHKRVSGGNGGIEVINLGTGQAISVLEMVKAFEAASGKKIPYKLGPRRPGDVPAVWADPAKAQTLLGWRAELGLEDMCKVSARTRRRIIQCRKRRAAAPGGHLLPPLPQ
jgi:UDP-glucose 4-epimerase